ncbi:uncharacterized protein LOC120200003 [Hibiscus syriacus]|uniref:uncharacterized protein LOC120200003 n=1 Tax=Hibiscus syriacus TaxID=106335 RepID=UPI0019205081|nr:uncharacterized protein LOC120200003 [Hibiscus syriacus]
MLKSYAGNPASSNQDSIPPLGITTESGPPLGFTPIHISARSSIPQEARCHAYVSNENQQQQMGSTFLNSYQSVPGRWRDVATQVQPPLLEKEATVIFVNNTLKAPYLGHLLENATKNFVNLVISGELIENAIKSGKIEAVDGSSSKKPVYRKKENEVNNANVYNKNTSKSVTITQPRDERNDTSTARNDSKGPRKENERMSFTPLPVPYSEIYASLLKADVVRPYRLTPLQPPYPHWYDVNAYCDYHDGITGHSIENCLAFKKVVQNLINTGGLQFDSPDVSTHPLPNHGGKGVNAVYEENRKKTKTDVDEIKSPFIWVFQQLYHVGMVQQDLNSKPNECENYCEYHQEEGHKIQLCPEFRGLLQKLMDNKEIEFFEKDEEKEEKIYPQGTLELHCQCFNDKGIWFARGNKFTKENDKTPGSSLKNEIVSEVGHFTKSGRCYSLETSKEADKGKLKGKATVVPQRIFNDEPLPLINESVTEAQAQEFLKFLKHSEYSVVEQLHKQQARISILDLLMNSEVHRNALLRVLNQTFVPEDKQ